MDKIANFPGWRADADASLLLPLSSLSIFTAQVAEKHSFHYVPNPTLFDSGCQLEIVCMETAMALCELTGQTIQRRGQDNGYVCFGKDANRQNIVGFLQGSGLVDQITVVESAIL